MSSLEIIEAFQSFTPDDLAILSKVDPDLYTKITTSYQFEKDKDEKTACELSLHKFVSTAWRHIDPAPFEDNWHVWMIADELEALADGEYRDLVCNLPPRCSKTNIISVCFIAWLWCQPKEYWTELAGPHTSFLCVSYGATFASSVATRCRRLIMGEWYQKHWGHQVQIRADQSSRDDFANTMGGERIANSIEGGILGRGALYQIIDDPHKVDEVESDTERKRVLQALREGLTTRITDPRISRRILTAQRLHEDDATNYALTSWPKAEMRHLCLRMRYEPSIPVYRDNRTSEGELLWPKRFSESELAKWESQLGPYAVDGQLQQRPSPRGGGLIKRDWWRLWPDDAERDADFRTQYKCFSCGWETEIQPVGPAIDCQMCGLRAERRIVYPDVSFSMLSVDTAYSDEDQVKNAFNAVTRWGVWHDRADAPRTMLMEMWRGRPPLTTGTDREGRIEKGLVDIVHEMAIRGRVDVVLIEKKTRGVDLYVELERQLRNPSPRIDDLNEAYLEHQIRSQITSRRNPWKPTAGAGADERRREQVLRSHSYRLEYFEPTGRGDKTARLVTCQPIFTNDLVWAPDKTWADTVIKEVSNAPRSQFLDLADTTTSALIYLREAGLLPMPYEYQAEVRRQTAFQDSGKRNSVSDMYEA